MPCKFSVLSSMQVYLCLLNCKWGKPRYSGDPTHQTRWCWLWTTIGKVDSMPKKLLQLAYKARSERFACGYYMNTLSSDKWIIVLYYECLYSGAGHLVLNAILVNDLPQVVQSVHLLTCRLNTMPLSISGLALLAQCTPIHTQFNVGYRYSGDPSLRTY